ncbi:MAG TPA: adenosine kinase [Hellea balneolensis]|uniref:Adenosine kinase n=1 Tax=Hellea balneolensis TaxID=287478 RepID=A0A7C5LUF2_9PROT|nr:adenosine kinase [Hellea balneolensis]
MGVFVEIEYEILGIGNAIMDVIAPISDDVLVQNGIEKGSMTLIDQDRALELHTVLETHSTDQISEIAGGSGANTIAGISALGVRAAYIGKVAEDDLGARFTNSLSAEGVQCCAVPLANGPSTARCLIGVTPDGERSMSTFLGANVAFGPDDIDENIVKSAGVTYLEGYLFDTHDQKAAFVHAAEIAKAAGRQVSLTLSDSFCVGRHREAFLHLVEHHVDILFANTDEILSLYETDDLQEALNRVSKADTIACVTRSEKGSVIIVNGDIHKIEAMPVAKVIDTTGAGDQYAAGVLAGRALGLDWPQAGRLGSICAAEVISHYGARPETNIADLAKQAGLEL